MEKKILEQSLSNKLPEIIERAHADRKAYKRGMAHGIWIAIFVLNILWYFLLQLTSPNN